MSYGYSRVGQQHRQEQTTRRGQRVSILGLWEPGKSFDDVLTTGSIDSPRYLAFMNAMADQAKDTLETTGRWTVVVMDNGSSHRSLAVQNCWVEWEKKGLFCFFLPPYCSEMNRIEPEWHHLKADEISGRMFQTEDDLAMAIIEGVEHRSKAAGFSPQLFQFICA